MTDPRSPVADWTRGAPELLLQACAACGHRWYLRRPCCPRCRAPDPDLHPVAGGGRLVAVTTVHRGPGGVDTPPPPYTLALVDLDDGVRVMARCDPDARPGDHVRLYFPTDPPQPHVRTTGL